MTATRTKSPETNYIALVRGIGVGKSPNHQLLPTSVRNILQQKQLALKRPQLCFLARSAGCLIFLRCLPRFKRRGLLSDLDVHGELFRC